MASGPRITSSLVDEIDDVLVCSFEDPAHPRHCHQFYAACFDVIRQYDLRLTKKQRSRRHYALFDTLIKFITLPGFSNLSRFVKTEQALCQCDLSRPLEQQMHRATPPAKFSLTLWEHVIRMVVIAIKAFLSTSPSHRSQQTDLHPLWPSSTSQIVPFGLQATLVSLVDTMNHRVPFMFQFVHTIIVVFGRPTTTKMLLDHPRVTFSLYNYLSIWAMHAEQIPLDEYAARQSDIIAVVVAVARVSDIVSDLFGSAPSALRKLIESACGPRDKFVVLWSRLLRFLLQARCSVASDLPFHMLQLLDDTTFHLASTGATLLRTLELPLNNTEYHPSILQRCIPEAWSSVFDRLGVTVRQARDNPRCFGPGCLETEATAARKFRVCAGCEHMTYCSKECQRRAWRDQRAPHKPICKRIRELQALGVRRPVWASVNLCQVPDDEFDYRTMVRTIIDLADHIDLL